MVRHFPPEAIIWIISLSLLAILDAGSFGFSLCPLANIGFEYCPGCGLGRSISLLLHGHLSESFEAHPFGIFAVGALSMRILSLTRNHIRTYGKSY